MILLSGTTRDRKKDPNSTNIIARVSAMQRGAARYTSCLTSYSMPAPPSIATVKLFKAPSASSISITPLAAKSQPVPASEKGSEESVAVRNVVKRSSLVILLSSATNALKFSTGQEARSSEQILALAKSA